MYTFLAILIAIPVGVGGSLFLTSSMLDKSNNFGDSKPSINDFCDGGITDVQSGNKVKKNTPLRDLAHPVILEHDIGKAETETSWLNKPKSDEELLKDFDSSSAPSPFKPLR